MSMSKGWGKAWRKNRAERGSLGERYRLHKFSCKEPFQHSCLFVDYTMRLRQY